VRLTTQLNQLTLPPGLAKLKLHTE